MMYKWRASLFTFLFLGALGLAFLVTSSAYAACPGSITNYWKLDENDPGTYADFINGNDGTGADDPTAATGKVNGAQQFNGTDQGIDVPADRSFSWYKDESFSIECWVKRDPLPDPPPGVNEVFVGRDDVSFGWWLGLDGSTGNASFYLKGKDGLRPDVIEGVNVADGEWHHVVAVRDDSVNENRLYVDGLLQDSVVFDYLAGFDSTSVVLNIGYFNGSFYFGGVLDEVALYDRALTPTEIDQHYTNGLAGHGIDYVAPTVTTRTGGGGGGGCFISTVDE